MYDLLLEIANGSAQAFEELYRLLSPKVYAFLRLRVHDQSDLQEILQDTFLVVWTQAKDFHRKSTVLTWVLGIAKHKLLDRWRSRRRDPDHTQLNDAMAERASDFTPEVIERLALSSAILRLPMTSRELLQLVFVQQLSYRDIATILDIPEGTVKSRVYQLRAQLRSLLNEEGTHSGRIL